VVTPAGKATMQQPDPAGVATTKPPQPPQSSRGNGAGQGDSGPPKGPRNVPGGGGGNAGTEIPRESAEPNPIETAPQALGTDFTAEPPLPPSTPFDSSAESPTATRAIVNTRPAAPLPERPIAGAGAPAAGQHGVDPGVPATLVPEQDQQPTPAAAPSGEL